MKRKLTTEEFVLLAIDKLKQDGRETVHTVFSGFNKAFREYFDGQDPVEEVKVLAKAGKISYRLCRGGAIIACPGVIKPQAAAEADITLKKMGL